MLCDAVVIVIVWYLDFVVSSNPVHAEVYSIQHYVLKLVIVLRH
jgi:hypothetical protein